MVLPGRTTRKMIVAGGTGGEGKNAIPCKEGGRNGRDLMLLQNGKIVMMYDDKQPYDGWIELTSPLNGWVERSHLREAETVPPAPAPGGEEWEIIIPEIRVRVRRV